ncbi:MAG: hypothetical protein N2999_08120, partial [Proteobacteria bacterium]|nr:hypothetical protein [Pseudomonadota bacterium]
MSGYLSIDTPLFFENFPLEGFERLEPPYGGKIVKKLINAIKGVINKITPFRENIEGILKEDLLYEVHPLIKVAMRGKIHYPSLNKSNFSLVDLPGELKILLRFGEWERKLPKTGKVEIYNTGGAVEIVGVGAAGEAWRVLFEENEAQGRAIIIIKEEIVWVYD